MSGLELEEGPQPQETLKIENVRTQTRKLTLLNLDVNFNPTPLEKLSTSLILSSFGPLYA